MGYAGGASVSFEPLSGGDWMAGLDSNPAQDSSYVNIDYALYGTGNNLYYYESGSTNSVILSGYATGDVCSIIYDGSTVIYMKNRTILRTVSANITAPLGFDSSIINGTLKNIRLSPLSSNNFDSVGGPNKPANNATSDLDLIVAGTGMTLRGNSVTRVGSAWDASVYSRNGYTGGASCEFSFPLGTEAMAGLETFPTENHSFATIDYAWYATPDGNMRIYLNGTAYNSSTIVTTRTATDIFGVHMDGSWIRFTKNGAVHVALYVPSNPTLYFDTSIVNGSINGMRFSPLTSNNFDQVGGPNKPQNGATVGAPSGTNVGSTPATTVEANAAAGAAGANKLNNPPVLGNVSNIITNYSAGGPAKTVSTINMSSTGGTGPYKYFYTYTSLQSNDEVEITFTKSSSGGNTDNTCVVKALTFTSGLVDKGELTVTVRDASGLTASYTAVVQITSVP
jgi:hypothetical protein